MMNVTARYEAACVSNNNMNDEIQIASFLAAF